MDGMRNKVAIVTGGGSGIGRATALALSHEGVKIVIADIVKQESERVVLEIQEGGGNALYIKTDVSPSSDVQQVVNKTVETYGRLDYAVNNAGIGGTQALTADCDEADWSKVIGVNLTGVWLCMKHEIPRMLDQGGGAIVNVSSILGLVGFANACAYTSSKHGIIGLTKVAAMEYAAKGLRINAVCPAFIATPMLERSGLTAGTDIYDAVVALHPIKRLGTPEEVAAMIVWLCSDTASFVTGSAMLVDGGYVAQ
ncbi:MAG: SDR family oxidoreductase [Anaerolineaceae bacterium]|nr:SDR family oxidoreductase [Anaerolineaceae bacterium]